ncbi:MAG: S41 family peptidase [Alphaproteobacteria bacterium]
MPKRYIAGAAGVLCLLVPAIALAASAETYRQLNLFGDVFERVRSDYVEEVSDADLIENAINGMLTSLDPHSKYLNPKNYLDMQVQTKGEFGGLGVEITMENGFVKVISPIDDTPASRAGIETGDMIVQIDGEPVLGLTLEQAVEKMRGPVDTNITITIQREGVEKPFDVTLTRAVIRIRSVRTRLEGNDIAYVRITSFTERTSEDLERALKDILGEHGTSVKGVVLDLRNNPGGLLDQAVQVSDDFLDQGEVVSTRGRRSDSIQRFNARQGDIAADLPMVVLINGGSASASEIVAGALQDHGRALLLGTKSFGKGSVQTIIPLSGQGAIRLTTARYYTPSGRSIQAKGIDPDIVVEQAKIERSARETSRSEASLRGHLIGPDEEQQPAEAPEDAGEPPATAVPPPEDAAPEGEAAPAPGEEAEDYQLTRALDLLRGLRILSSKPVAVN